jgi:GntR family transcriptional regulator, vanillate catabolism transcriptional regulator
MGDEIDNIDSRGASQTVKALMSMRELLLTGELTPGQRVSEIWAVDRLGVSRTPVRAALARLQEEGFLEPLPGGGYAVKSFTAQDTFDAIEIRGTMEGLAARLAAERGADPERLEALDDILGQIDDLLDRPEISPEDCAAYARLNEAFHTCIAEAPGGQMLRRQTERAAALPFAHPSGFVKAQAERQDMRRILIIAQDHHRCVVDAIRHREGARAEALMREHARLATRNLRLALENQRALGLVAGARLIRDVAV